MVELIELDYIHRRGEFQIIIAPQAQGQGYATAATQLAIDYAFSVLNLRKIYLIVDKSNTAAIHVYEKCGFRHEAELIEEFFGNGSITMRCACACSSRSSSRPTSVATDARRPYRGRPHLSKTSRETAVAGSGW